MKALDESALLRQLPNAGQRDPPFVPSKRLPDWASLELSLSVESCGCGLGGKVHDPQELGVHRLKRLIFL